MQVPKGVLEDKLCGGRIRTRQAKFQDQKVPQHVDGEVTVCNQPLAESLPV